MWNTIPYKKDGKYPKNFTTCVCKIEECYLSTMPIDQKNPVCLHQKRDSSQGSAKFSDPSVCIDFVQLSHNLGRGSSLE